MYILFDRAVSRYESNDKFCANRDFTRRAVCTREFAINNNKRIAQWASRVVDDRRR